MEVIEAIKKEGVLEAFSNIEISNEIIEDILNCGRLAPSAKNRQPWLFTVVKGKVKDDIADIMIQNITSEQLKHYKQILHCDNSVKSTAKVITESNVLILIFRKNDDNWIIGDNLSIGACVENMCLRATELELGTLWIRDTVHSSEKIKEYLNKNNVELNCALAIGYPNQKPKQRPRKNLKDIMEWYE